MTYLEQTDATQSAVTEGNSDQDTFYDELIELLLLNIDLYIEATLIVAKKRRTRRADRLNEAMRTVLTQVRDTLHAHFLVEGYRAALYDETAHENLLADELGPLTAEIFDGTTLSDTSVAALHSTMLRKQLRVMIDFVAGAFDAEPRAASTVVEGCQILFEQKAAIEEFARDAETV